jgi:hypothetical protein
MVQFVTTAVDERRSWYIGSPGGVFGARVASGPMGRIAMFWSTSPPGLCGLGVRPDLTTVVVYSALASRTDICGGVSPAAIEPYRQLGSQISIFQVPCEIGIPVNTGNSQAKFVITSAM